MGFVKNQWMEEQERGYSGHEGDVCFPCLGPGPISNWINPNEIQQGTCNYCSTITKVFPVSHLTQVVFERISLEWEGLFEAALPRDDETGLPFLHEHSWRGSG